MFTPYSHLYDYSTIHIICRFHPKDFYTTVLIPIEVVEMYTVCLRINDTSDLLFEQANKINEVISTLSKNFSQEDITNH